MLMKYEPLCDDVIVVLREPVEYENKSIYYGEWCRKTQQRHGRGFMLWADGSKYEGYWKNDKASVRGKLFHANGDVYEGKDTNEYKASGSMIRLMVMECIAILMALNTMVSGKMISNTERVRKPGPITDGTKEIM
jgi:hypothetical protein